MIFKKKKKIRKEGGEGKGFLILSFVLVILLLIYVVFGISSLSSKFYQVFGGASDKIDPAFGYDLELFDEMFPGMVNFELIEGEIIIEDVLKDLDSSSSSPEMASSTEENLNASTTEEIEGESPVDPVEQP